MHPGEDRAGPLRPLLTPVPNGRGAPQPQQQPPGARRGQENQAAADYWRQYAVMVHWDRPLKVSGTVIRLTEIQHRGDWVPKIHLQTPKGREVIVVPYQDRLLAELVRLAPAVGDRVTIDYRGEASSAAPGMRPAKEFVVTVTRPEDPPADPTGEGPR